MKLSPASVAVASGLAGVGAAVGGVYVLAGGGWALLAVALPLLALCGIICRGLMRAAE